MEVILPAVDVQNVYKSYNKKVPVLQDTNLLVRKGNIYGLLGPSGCGKTTLLKLVVGRLSPNSGKVRVLGHRPGTAVSKIPGSRIGYMPQELSLYLEFTISETLHFFGRIHNMSGKDIAERMAFLISFLDLPSATRQVKQLSGGQQRRVSLAVALLHSPEILILDEPTVGVDPLLRQRIWDHLVGISSTGGISIIITTHYIEEARAANSVGLMRNGRIMAEGSPDRLLQKYNQSSLEDVFLHLCLRDDNIHGESMKRGKSTSEETAPLAAATPPASDTEIVDAAFSGGEADDVQLLDDDRQVSRSRSVSITSYDDTDMTLAANCNECCSSFPKAQNILALFIKNCNQLRRKIGFLLFQFLLPAIQIALFAFCIGGTPSNLPIKIVNQDVGISLLQNLSVSEAYINGLDKKVVQITYADDVESATDTVKAGDCWAVLWFKSNYSIATMKRMINPQDNSTATITQSNISIYIDATNAQIFLTLEQAFVAAYENLGTNIQKQAKERNIPLPQVFTAVSVPLDYKPAIYGTFNETFLDFVAPGMMCSIIYFLAVGLTTLSLVVERKEGLFERSLVSGVTVAEMMLGHIGTQFVVVSIQTAVLIIFAFLVFNVYDVGSLIIIIMIELLVGITGMTLGFVVSTAAKDEQSATQLSLALVFPFLLLSGILWPIEGMPQWLQYISVALPLTQPVAAMRSVLGRGFGFDHYQVWSGYCIGVGWALGFLILSLILARLKGLH
ncbi:ABC transporter G family member 20-like [Watersipora subatra]|uniref:ABC transporter G family member 20-like n=1 Tax=Watersipora subatra TaxID=2589382 RepID=UPI00355B0F6C